MEASYTPYGDSNIAIWPCSLCAVAWIGWGLRRPQRHLRGSRAGALVQFNTTGDFLERSINGALPGSLERAEYMRADEVGGGPKRAV